MNKVSKKILDLLKMCADASHCPVCENDLRPRYHCTTCEIDHMGKKCFRDGKHADDCLLWNTIQIQEKIKIKNRKKYPLRYSIQRYFDDWENKPTTTVVETGLTKKEAEEYIRKCEIADKKEYSACESICYSMHEGGTW